MPLVYPYTNKKWSFLRACNTALRLYSVKPGLVVIGLLLFMLNGCKTNVDGATMSATANGNWENSSTWSGSRAPASNDTLTIPSGKTVTVTTVTAEYSNMLINVSGTLHFNGGKKIRMCDGKVDVAVGGKLEADNAGSKVDICSYMAWDGNDPGTGPLTIVNPHPLPVLIKDATARVDNDAVVIQWSTESEVECDHYTIERSRDGDNFIEIGIIKGAGTTTSPHHYSHTDLNPYKGRSYYRLLQTDFDGRTEVLKVLVVKASIDDIALYPNPFAITGPAHIELDIPNNAELVITATDKSGREIFTWTCLNAEDRKNMLLRLREQIVSPGVYSVKITLSDAVYYKKLAVVD
jgi:hypothetical protein